MLAGREHRRNSDSWRDIVRERPGDSRIRVGVLGRDRCGREELSQSDEAERVLHTEGDHDGYGLRWPRNRDGGHRHRKWCPQALKLILHLLLAASVWSCDRRGGSPETLYEHANRAFLVGELKKGQDEAEQGYRKFRYSNPEWASKFRILQAKSALWRGLYPEVLTILDSSSHTAARPEMAISRLALVGVAKVYLHDFPEAESDLDEAARLCKDFAGSDCGEVLQALGFLASERKQSASAEEYYKLGLKFADSHYDAFLKSTSLLNLGAESLSQGRFDEAIDWTQAAHQVASALDSKAIDFVIEGNLGWAYYRLGDLEKAYNLEIEALALATQLQDVSNQENQLTNIGYIYLDQRKFDLAAKSFQRALQLAESIKAKEQVYNAQRVLARLALQTGNLDEASAYSERAMQSAKESGIHSDELYPMLVQGQIAAQRGDRVKAQQLFESVEHDQTCPVFLKWETEHSLARLYEDQKLLNRGDREYRAALTTFELARSTVRREDFQISFLTNGAALYDDYVHFLVARHKDADALKWADFSRARTLAEGLGIEVDTLRQTSFDFTISPPQLNAQNIARQANALILFYWLGEKQSYLWAANSNTTHLYTLPPRSDIEAAVQRYRSALNGPQNVLESGGEDGRALYQMLIAPAQSMLHPNGKVYILPDGSLNNLNFETLIVPSP